MVALAAHDNGRLRDQGQTLLNPVGDRRPQGRQKRSDPEPGFVARSERDQRRRFPPRLAKSGEELVSRRGPLRIHRRTDEHQRSGPIRPACCELRNDLAAHRVRHERGTLEPGRVEPVRESVSELGDAERRRRPLTAPAPGQVRDEYGEGRRERLRQREHVGARNAAPVHEDDGPSCSEHARVHVQSGYVERPALDRPRGIT
jgi:hypothetical protein